MSFLRRNKGKQAAPPPPPTAMQEEVTAQEYLVRLAFVARSSDGLRLPADPAVLAAIPQIVEPLSETPIEVIEPLPLEDSDAAPNMERVNEMQQGVLASGFSLGEAEQARLPAIGSRSGLSCAHCGFEAGSAAAFYCPKCGMRMVRGASAQSGPFGP